MLRVLAAAAFCAKWKKGGATGRVSEGADRVIGGCATWHIDRQTQEAGSRIGVPRGTQCAEEVCHVAHTENGEAQGRIGLCHVAHPTFTYSDAIPSRLIRSSNWSRVA